MSDPWDGLATTQQGEGPGVLWLHGYTMRAEVWRELWSHLPGWRHVGLDLPWHGRSRPLHPGEDLARLADAVVTAARQAAVRHVVALSFGTVLAVEMAVRHPYAFASWTLAAPSLAGMPHEPAVRRRYVDLAALYRREGPGPHMTALWMSCPPAIFAGLAARPRLRRRLARLIDRHMWTELADGGMRRLVERPQSSRALGTLAAPVLLLVGSDDLFTHLACARSIRSAVLHGSIELLPGTGHLAPLERPAAAARIVDAHLHAA